MEHELIKGIVIVSIIIGLVVMGFWMGILYSKEKYIPQIDKLNSLLEKWEQHSVETEQNYKGIAEQIQARDEVIASYRAKYRTSEGECKDTDDPNYWQAEQIVQQEEDKRIPGTTC